MAQGFQVRRETGPGKILEREYELVGNTIVMLANRAIKISVGEFDDPVALIEAYERKMRPTLKGPFEILRFESRSGTYFLQLPGLCSPILGKC